MNADGTQMNTDPSGWTTLSERTTGCIGAVADATGGGFPSMVHEHARWRNCGIPACPAASTAILYDGVAVGACCADLLAGNANLIWLTAARALDSAHRAQWMNALRATGLHHARR